MKPSSCSSVELFTGFSSEANTGDWWRRGNACKVRADIRDVGIRQNLWRIGRHSRWLAKERNQAFNRPRIGPDVWTRPALTRRAMAFVAANAQKGRFAFDRITTCGLLLAPSPHAE